MVIRKLQYACRSSDTLIADNHGTVVQGRIGREYVFDQLGRNLRVHHRAGFDHIAQLGGAFDAA